MPLQNQTFKGIILVLLFMFIFGLVDNCLIFITDRIGLWQFHAIRNLFNVVALVLTALVMGWSLWPKRPLWVAARGAFFTIAMCLYFGAIGFVSVAEAAAGLFTAPIFLLLISILFLRKRVEPVHVLAVALGFAGVLIVLRPFAGDVEFTALMPVIGGFFYALSLLITQKKCGDEDTHLLVMWFFAILGIVGLVGLLAIEILGESQDAGFLTRGWRGPNLTEWLWLGFMSFGAFIGLPFQARAYQIADANVLSIFEYSILIFAGFWAYVLFGDLPGPWEVVGMAFIALAGAVLSLHKMRQAR